MPYPNLPDHRMLYDRDGSVGFWHTGSGSVTSLSTGQMQGLNGEAAGGPEFDNGFWGIIFPEFRDITGLGTQIGSAGGHLNVYSSTDTTNGMDGTWTLVSTGSILNNTIPNGWAPTPPRSRTNITTISIPAIKAIRFTADTLGGDKHWYGCHLYGTSSTGTYADRLRIWHPTLDSRVDGNYFNWGDQPRNTTIDKTFRIKNTSPSRIAHTVVVSADILTDTSPSINAEVSFSLDGTNFFPTVTVSAISSLSISPILSVRWTLPSNAQLSLTAFRIIAVPGTF